MENSQPNLSDSDRITYDTHKYKSEHRSLKFTIWIKPSITFHESKPEQTLFINSIFESQSKHCSYPINPNPNTTLLYDLTPGFESKLSQNSDSESIFKYSAHPKNLLSWVYPDDKKVKKTHFYLKICIAR